MMYIIIVAVLHGLVKKDAVRGVLLLMENVKMAPIIHVVVVNGRKKVIMSAVV